MQIQMLIDSYPLPKEKILAECEWRYQQRLITRSFLKNSSTTVHVQ
jgi:hypothetical protein